MIRPIPIRCGDLVSCPHSVRQGRVDLSAVRRLPPNGRGKDLRIARGSFLANPIAGTRWCKCQPPLTSKLALNAFCRVAETNGIPLSADNRAATLARAPELKGLLQNRAGIFRADLPRIVRPQARHLHRAFHQGADMLLPDAHVTHPLRNPDVHRE